MDSDHNGGLTGDAAIVAGVLGEFAKRQITGVVADDLPKHVGDILNALDDLGKKHKAARVAIKATAELL